MPNMVEVVCNVIANHTAISGYNYTRKNALISSSSLAFWTRNRVHIDNPDRKTFAMWKIARIGRGKHQNSHKRFGVSDEFGLSSGEESDFEGEGVHGYRRGPWLSGTMASRSQWVKLEVQTHNLQRSWERWWCCSRAFCCCCKLSVAVQNHIEVLLTLCTVPKDINHLI